MILYLIKAMMSKYICLLLNLCHLCFSNLHLIKESRQWLKKTQVVTNEYLLSLGEVSLFIVYMQAVEIVGLSCGLSKFKIKVVKKVCNHIATLEQVPPLSSKLPVTMKRKCAQPLTVNP